MKKVILTVTVGFIFLVSCSSGNDESNNNTNNNSTTTESTNTEPLVNNESNASNSSAAIVVPEDINLLLEKNTCLSCHEANEKVVGPAYKEVAKRNYTNEQIVELIYKPKPSNWPDYPTPMVGLPNVPKAEALKIAEWINSLK